MEVWSVLDSQIIFNIVGNKYQLIARVNYRTQRVFVLYVLTHGQYDKGDWKA